MQRLLSDEEFDVPQTVSRGAFALLASANVLRSGVSRAINVLEGTSWTLSWGDRMGDIFKYALLTHTHVRRVYLVYVNFLLWLGRTIW